VVMMVRSLKEQVGICAQAKTHRATEQSALCDEGLFERRSKGMAERVIKERMGWKQRGFWRLMGKGHKDGGWWYSTNASN
jgi:hypothetical protein